MRVTILPYAIILTKAYRAAVSIMVKGCTVPRVLPLRCFFYLLPNYTNMLVYFCRFAIFSDEPKYSQTALLQAAHSRMLVKW